jgi:BirA family biotin operon repressor/biotin-[acetyl-CoA-carboxylase] ligase
LSNQKYDWTFIHREVVDSTNNLAHRLAVEGEVRWPLVVWAARQTSGRGRGSHAWWSDEGSLTFTIGLDPAAHGLRVVHEPRLALAAAVAVIEAIAPLAPTAALGIRWPNDIEAAGRKLGGILPERVETTAGARLLVGIGLNVRTRLADAPPEVQRMATSIEALRGSPYDAGMADLLGSILTRFEQSTAALVRDDPTLAERWRQLDSLAGEWVRVQQVSQTLTGRALGIEPDGSLRLLTERGPINIQGGQVLRDPLSHSLTNR